MKQIKTFGSFLTQKRQEKEISLRQLAAKLELSPVYLCNLEKDRRPAPRAEILEHIAEILLLTQDEKETMYDLAARSKGIPAVSSDLPEYIMDRGIVRIALRTAKDLDATDEEWQEFIEKLNRRKKYLQEMEENDRKTFLQRGSFGSDCPKSD